METCASELNRPVLTRTTPTEETRLVCLRCGAQLCSRRVAVVCVRRHSHSLFFFFFLAQYGTALLTSPGDASHKQHAGHTRLFPVTSWNKPITHVI